MSFQRSQFDSVRILGVSAGAAILAAAAALAGGGPVLAQAVDRGPIAASLPQVDQNLVDSLARGEHPDILVKFRGRPDLSAAQRMPYRERGRHVYDALTTYADSVQAHARRQLQVRHGRDSGARDYVVLWIDNSIAVPAADAALLDTLRALPEIESIRMQTSLQIPAEPSQPARESGSRTPVSSISRINAPDVWALGYRGQGVVVGNIDSGVRHTHQALVNQYRGHLGDGVFQHDYNWYDPYQQAAAPRTTHPHGSHTVGTSVGDDGGSNQIGVAPGAQWMACIGFGLSGAQATEAGLLECGQFMLAPTDVAGGAPNPDLRPAVVNNSWGDCGRSYSDFYEGVVDAWIAAGIVPVFSNGNASNCGYATPPGLNTVGNPARSGKVLGVGSTGNSNGAYAPHSNWGPTDHPNPGGSGYPDPRNHADLKPNVVAPGVTITSAGDAGDSSFITMSGTSMSAPQVAGLVALIWDAAPCLRGDYARTGTIIMETAVAIPYASGSPSDGDGNVPNQATGWGEIDALAAVEAALEYCGPQGVVAGAVAADEDEQPIAGARLRADGDHVYSFTSDDEGLFLQQLSAGAYTLTTSAYGRVTDARNIVVTEGETLQLDIELELSPSHPVSGIVTDATTGWPVHARLRIATPHGDVLAWSAPETGAYSVDLPAGHDHVLLASATMPGYQPRSIDIPAINGPAVVDVALAVDEIDCLAPGYVSDGTLLEEFEAGVLPAGWQVDTDRPGGEGWRIGDDLGSIFWPVPDHTVYAASNDDAFGANSDASRERLITPPFSFVEGLSPFVSFRSAFGPGSSLLATLEISFDDGTTWTSAHAPTPAGTPGAPQWRDEWADLSAYAGQTFKLAFRTDDQGTWASGWAVDDVFVSSEQPCAAPAEGGLILGRVFDAETAPAGLNGATVAGNGGTSTTTAASEDPSLGDGYYVLYAAAGTAEVTASLPPYGEIMRRIQVPSGGAVRLDLDFSGQNDAVIFAHDFECAAGIAGCGDGGR